MLVLASELSALRINSVSQTCCVLLSLSVYRGQEVAAVSFNAAIFSPFGAVVTNICRV